MHFMVTYCALHHIILPLTAAMPVKLSILAKHICNSQQYQWLQYHSKTAVFLLQYILIFIQRYSKEGFSFLACDLYLFSEMTNH